MQTAKHVPTPAAVPVSKLDRTDWSRVIWRDAYSMARRMIRPRAGYSLPEAESWFHDHAFVRFGPAGFATVLAAGNLVFAKHCFGRPVAESIAVLERQGLVTRTRRPRPGNLTATVANRASRYEYHRNGISIAWSFDRLAPSGLRRGARAWELAKRREAAAAERASARAAAAVIAAEKVGVEPRYALTVTGLLVLREAEAGEAAHV